LPPPPYHLVARPDFNYFGRYRGQVIAVTEDSLTVTATAPPRPPGRTSPLVAVLDQHDTRALLFSADGRALTVRYHIPAQRLRLEGLDLRWPGVLRGLAPGDTFTAATWRDGKSTCISMNGTARCGLGYPIGDGWKLIFYPEGWRAWELTALNALWIAGLVVGVGFWTARGRRGGAAAIGLVLLGLVLVPIVTGLQATPPIEWLGALGGLAMGWLPRASGLFDTPPPRAT
jgi:hypothetical protein